jgi:hypothetical protein
LHQTDVSRDRFRCGDVDQRRQSAGGGVDKQRLRRFRQRTPCPRQRIELSPAFLDGRRVVEKPAARGGQRAVKQSEGALVGGVCF